MEKQLDELITEFARALRRLASEAQSISLSLTVYNTNRLDWNLTVQHTSEDRTGYNKNRALPPD